jgi:hypothetical protein
LACYKENYVPTCKIFLLNPIRKVMLANKILNYFIKVAPRKKFRIEKKSRCTLRKAYQEKNPPRRVSTYLKQQGGYNIPSQISSF